LRASHNQQTVARSATVFASNIQFSNALGKSYRSISNTFNKSGALFLCCTNFLVPVAWGMCSKKNVEFLTELKKRCKHTG